MAQIKITAAVRAAVRAILARSSEFDADTMRIGRDGAVTALKDADKTFSGPDSRRWHVGYVDNMVRQDGTIQEGH